MYKLFSLSMAGLLAIHFFVGCRGRNTGSGGENDVLVKVGDHTLTRAELNEALPKGLSAVDSATFSDNFVKQWAEDILLYDVAAENLPDMVRIERMVEQYRRDLVIFEYQKQLMNEKLSREIPESEIKAYYEANPGRFRLKSGIIKGLFLKVPYNSPRINQLKKWYKSGKPEAVENIEKYGLQNAVIYEYFYDRWIPFKEVMNNIPYEISDETAFLRTRHNIEYQDSSYLYLLNISDVLTEGSEMPFDFARKQIEEILLNHRKNEFIRNTQRELYDEAFKKGEIEFPGLQEEK